MHNRRLTAPPPDRAGADRHRAPRPLSSFHTSACAAAAVEDSSSTAGDLIVELSIGVAGHGSSLQHVQLADTHTRRATWPLLVRRVAEKCGRSVVQAISLCHLRKIVDHALNIVRLRLYCNPWVSMGLWECFLTPQYEIASSLLVEANSPPPRVQRIYTDLYSDNYFACVSRTLITEQHILFLI